MTDLPIIVHGLKQCGERFMELQFAGSYQEALLFMKWIADKITGKNFVEGLTELHFVNIDNVIRGVEACQKAQTIL